MIRPQAVPRSIRRTQAVRTNSARYRTPRSCSRLSYTRGMVSSILTALLAPLPWSSEGGATEKITIPPRVASETHTDQANHGRLSARPNPGLSNPKCNHQQCTPLFTRCRHTICLPSACYHMLCLRRPESTFRHPSDPSKEPQHAHNDRDATTHCHNQKKGI